MRLRIRRGTDGTGGATASTVPAMRALRPTLGRRTSSQASDSASLFFFH
jgi:hypothetical protein